MKTNKTMNITKQQIHKIKVLAEGLRNQKTQISKNIISKELNKLIKEIEKQ